MFDEIHEFLSLLNHILLTAFGVIAFIIFAALVFTNEGKEAQKRIIQEHRQQMHSEMILQK